MNLNKDVIMKTFPFIHGQYIRIAEYKIEDVLPFVVSDRIMRYIREHKIKKGSPEYIKITEKKYDGHMVKMMSQRYQLFVKQGITCVQCGVVGQYFGLEKNKNEERERYHFNLYGIKDGVETLITKDHILPKSKGGKDTLKNYQVMCFECNSLKGDEYED